MPTKALSASAVELFRRCQRAWAFRYLEGHREPEGGGALLGTRVHSILEAYSEKGLDPDLHETMEIRRPGKDPVTYWPGQIALSGMHLLPPPGTMIIEGKFDFSTSAGPWTGRLDGEYGIDAAGKAFNPMRKWGGYGPSDTVVVLDHKTTIDKKYEKDLATDIQANLYAWVMMEKHRRDAVLNRWVYYLTSGTSRHAWVSERLMSRADVAAQVEGIHADAREIHRLYAIRPKANDLRPTTTACDMFGGCAHKGRCEVSAIDVLFPEGGDASMNTAELNAFLDQKLGEKSALTGAPPLPGSVPAVPAAEGSGSPGWWKPGDPMNPAQEYFAAQGKPIWMIASAADKAPPIEVCRSYETAPALPVHAAINPPESAAIKPAASPAEMPPVPAPVASAAAPTNRAALKAKAMELGLVDASSKLGEKALADLIAKAGGAVPALPAAPVEAPAAPALPISVPIAIPEVAAPKAIAVATVTMQRGPMFPGETMGGVGFTLYVNCLPQGRAYATLADVMREVLPIFVEREKVADYRLLPYGEGAGKIAGYLDAYLREKAAGLSGVVIDARSPEGALALATFERHAAFVVRGF